MERDKLDELRKKRDELKEKATQMRKEWIEKNPDKIVAIKKATQKRKLFFIKLTEKYNSRNKNDKINKITNYMNTRTVAGISILLNILAIGIWADWYWTHKHISQYRELVKNYETMAEADSDLWSNCSDVATRELTNEEFDKHIQQGKELLQKKEATTRIINQSRNELSLD